MLSEQFNWNEFSDVFRLAEQFGIPKPKIALNILIFF